MSEAFHAFSSVFLADSDQPINIDQEKSAFVRFPIRSVVQYESFCDDFGPMNLGSIYHFCTSLDACLRSNPEKTIVVCSDDNKPSKTNACFLVGANMIMRLGQSPESVHDRFEPLLPDLLSYRDISPGPQNFDLRLHDCWEALGKGLELDWVDFDDGFDYEEYMHYDNPINGDLHVIVPEKLVAMKGPVDLPNGKVWQDTAQGTRDFSAEHYAQVLLDFDVCAVVRLNEPRYATGPFRAAGIAVADMLFDDCRPPPDAVVAKFLLLAETAQGGGGGALQGGAGADGDAAGAAPDEVVRAHGAAGHGLAADRALGICHRRAAALPLRHGASHRPHPRPPCRRPPAGRGSIGRGGRCRGGGRAGGCGGAVGADPGDGRSPEGF
jgi:cell division cycle 14